MSNIQYFFLRYTDHIYVEYEYNLCIDEKIGHFHKPWIKILFKTIFFDLRDNVIFLVKIWKHCP